LIYLKQGDARFFPSASSELIYNLSLIILLCICRCHPGVLSTIQEVT